MYKLIGTEPTEEESKFFYGYLESPTQYIQVFADGEQVTLRHGVDKSKYRSYEHYAGVIGKFDPETRFFKKGITLKELSRKAIDEAFLEWQSGRG